MSHFLLLTVLSFGILAGPKATTDGYVYLGHNEDIPGDKMLNIYNVPAAPDRLAGLWFEFPGQIGDSYINEYGVCLVSNHTPSRENKVRGKFDYEIQTKVFNQARSAREAVEIIGAMVGRHGYKGNGRSYLIADSKVGWVCSVVGGKRWVAQRVPDDEIMVIKDVSKLLTEPSTRTDETALTTVFTMNPAYPPERGTVIWVGFPNQDTKDFRERWPEVLRKKDGGEAILQPCSLPYL